LPAGGGALAITAGDAMDDRERPMSDVPNLGKKNSEVQCRCLVVYHLMLSNISHIMSQMMLGISRLDQSISRWLHV